MLRLFDHHVSAYRVSFVVACLFQLLIADEATAEGIGRQGRRTRTRMTNAPPAFLVPSQAVGAKTNNNNNGADGRSRRTMKSQEATACSSSLSSPAGPSRSTTRSTVSASATFPTSASALNMLAPSQAIRAGSSAASSPRKHDRNRQRNRSKRSDTALTAAAGSSDASESPATAPASPRTSPTSDADEHDNSSSSSSTSSASSQAANTHHDTTNPKQRRRIRHRSAGNIPDVHWRAIPLDHLRHHPSFEALPHPDTVTALDSLEDVRLFRQDSWQWDALHSGRCTTSQATAALGLLESRAGSELGIPRSLQKGAVGAYHRLGRPGLRSLEDMREVLCTGEGNSPPELEMLDYPVWDTAKNSARAKNGNGNKGNEDANTKKEKKQKNGQLNQQQHKDFAANYLPRIKKSDLERRRRILKDYYLKDTSRWVARMQWGNAQEPTSLLTALNYFTRAVPGTKIREVGMCGAGLDINATSSPEGADLIVGATPDAVIHYPNGTLEALEVKNHCPFVPMYWGSRKPSHADKDLFRIREVSQLPVDVPPAYVPQLMLEMLSLGPQCRSAIMVRQTATKGAVILRLQRDDDWIEEMLYWLNQFMDRFVNRGEPPPPNVFWDDNEHSGGERYRSFVNRTKEISESAQLVARVPHGDIQRVVGTKRHQIPLFLD